MITSNEIKQIALKNGSDLCGIASIDRFANAPTGFHPQNIFQNTKSVISIACRVPKSTLESKNFIPYTVSENRALDKIHNISINICLEIEDLGFKAIPVPSTPYIYWDSEKMEGKGILSLKHIAYLSGIGIIGKNFLLCNEKYGNLIKLGAILTDIDLEADPIIENNLCSDKCNLCIKKCPVGAIDETGVNQRKCRQYAEIKNKRGVEITVCNTCRKVCPNFSGYKL